MDNPPPYTIQRESPHRRRRESNCLIRLPPPVSSGGQREPALGAEGGRAFHLACNPVDTNYLAVACGDYVARVFDRRWVGAQWPFRFGARDRQTRHGCCRPWSPLPAALDLGLERVRAKPNACGAYIVVRYSVGCFSWSPSAIRSRSWLQCCNPLPIPPMATETSEDAD